LQEETIKKLKDENKDLSIENFNLKEEDSELMQDLINRDKAISRLKGTLQTIVMKLEDFYWCVPQLKKDIKNIIKE